MSTEIDGVGGSQTLDQQGEILDVAGADISDLVAGKGFLDDNHSNKLADNLGRITYAQKILKIEDCKDERQKYYWNKVKAPYIYFRAKLYDDKDSDHRSAKAAAAILRHQHRDDSPLILKCSVEGGIVERGEKDKNLLKRTKIKAIALTYVPANSNTMCEGLNLAKTNTLETDMALIKSCIPLIRTDVPSFIEVADALSENKIRSNILKIKSVVQQLKKSVVQPANLNKALTAGYGGGSPTESTGGLVLQSESLEGSRGFKNISCPHCGKEQIYMKHQVRCRSCDKAFPIDTLAPAMLKSMDGKQTTKWYVKVKGSPTFHPLKDIVDTKDPKNPGNWYHLANGTKEHNSNIEDMITEKEFRSIK
jgi:hypothetical protein